MTSEVQNSDVAGNIEVDRYFLNNHVWKDGDQVLLSILGRWLDKLPWDILEPLLKKFGDEVKHVNNAMDERDLYSFGYMPARIVAYDDNPHSDQHQLCLTGSWVECLLDDGKLTAEVKALIQDFAAKVRAIAERPWDPSAEARKLQESEAPVAGLTPEE